MEDVRRIFSRLFSSEDAGSGSFADQKLEGFESQSLRFVRFFSSSTIFSPQCPQYVVATASLPKNPTRETLQEGHLRLSCLIRALFTRPKKYNTPTIHRAITQQNAHPTVARARASGNLDKKTKRPIKPAKRMLTRIHSFARLPFSKRLIANASDFRVMFERIVHR